MLLLSIFPGLEQDQFFCFSSLRTTILILISILLLSLILIITPRVYSAQVRLVWDANTEPYLGGYKLYYGYASGNYDFTIDVGNQTTYTLSVKTGVTYYCAVTAYDTSRTYESDFSNELIVNVASPFETVYEDAEDGTTMGWSIYGSNPSLASVENVYDYMRKTRVIKLTDYLDQQNTFHLVKDNGDEWHNSSQFIIEWSMQYSEPFSIYIDLETTAGERYLHYTPDSDNELGDDVYVHYGLGAWAADGYWHTFVRDLQADLAQAQPGVTILEVNGFLITGSGIVDDIKLLSPLSADHDGDLITDEDELNIYGTNPYMYNTDMDGIGDGIELAFWGNRWRIDFDFDGLHNLLDYDSDNDGFSDGVEIELGFDPSDPSSKPPDEQEDTIYEDAEDGATHRWVVYGSDTSWAEVVNVFDEKRQSRVIELKDNSQTCVFTLTDENGNKWGNSNQFVINWSMRYHMTFVLYVEVSTSVGLRYLYYTPHNDDYLGNGMFVHHGLGTGSGSTITDGQWHTFERDLKADLADAQPEVNILEVNGFLIRGPGRLDDIKLCSASNVDSDGDLISDHDEIYIYGTNPKIADTDNDGISDSRELAYWGASWGVDYDADGKSNLLDYDSDNDGFSDGVEMSVGSSSSSPEIIPPTVYEDAEDGTINGWTVENNPKGTLIKNILDYERQSRVIHLVGYGQISGFSLRNEDGSKWQNSSQFILEWSMQYSEPFKIYIDVQTTLGQRYLCYTQDNYDISADKVIGKTYVYNSLGSGITDGSWHTFVRDLQADLTKIQPGVDIVEVNGFSIHGSGKLDDIILRSF